MTFSFFSNVSPNAQVNHRTDRWDSTLVINNKNEYFSLWLYIPNVNVNFQIYVLIFKNWVPTKCKMLNLGPVEAWKCQGRNLVEEE